MYANKAHRGWQKSNGKDSSAVTESKAVFTIFRRISQNTVEVAGDCIEDFVDVEELNNLGFKLAGR